MTRLAYLVECVDNLAHKVESPKSKVIKLMDKKAAGEEGAFQVCKPIIFNLIFILFKI